MKRALILSLLLSLAACGDSAPELLAKAKDAYASHDYRAAKLHLAGALKQEPGNRDMLLLQARTLIALGDGSGAGTALEKLAGKAPPPGELAELSAEAALLRKAPEAALTMLGSMESVEAERLRALAAIQQEDLIGAGEHFAKAVELGGNARAFSDYARYRLIAGDVAGAIEMAERARKAAPDGLDTLLVSGQLALRQGDLKRALEKYARASQLYPASLAAMTGQAAVLGDLGRIEEMSRIVEMASDLAPNDRTVAYLKARAGVAKKDWRGVVATVESFEGELAQRDPLRLLYGEALMRLGQKEQAIAQIGPIARAQPGNSTARLLLAEAQLAAGDAGGAVTTLRSLADSPMARPNELALMVKAAKAAGDPQLARYEARLRSPAVQALGRDIVDADYAMQKGNWAGAAEAYERVLSATDGRNVMVLNNMAYAQLMLGNHDEANAFARRALKEAPDNPSVLDTVGWTTFRSGGDIEEARRLLRLAAKKAPKNLTIRAHLAEVEHRP